ncbi:MAG: GIY-YIG nuclease family protein [Candidatus Acidiferrales bacterium]
MLTKQKILDEIRRTASQNGGKALGIARFESETGIKPYDWERFWAGFGDAVKEAGFVPNQLVPAHAESFLFEKLVGLTRKLGRFPTYREITVEKNNDSEFPNKTVFQRLGSKGQLAKRILEYCQDKEGYGDIAAFCSVVLEESNKEEISSDGRSGELIGEVYLFKSGRYYKIGKTNDTVRRGSEIRIQLPERMNLVHSIKTDDPIGVEAYWHRRFEPKRMNGEWFDLNTSDVQAFKRWRRIL